MENLSGGRRVYDVAVLGGGPAGTSAAITAARYGASVLLLEKGTFPRQKVCGEFVSAESLQLLASLLSKSFNLLEQAPRLHHARLFIQNTVLKVPVHPAAASIPRVDLDLALWEVAKGAGVEASPHQTVKSISANSPFVISTSGHSFTARSVINTSGRWSNLNGKTPPNSEKWVGLKAHFAESVSPDSVDLYFFKHGYCGVQPVGVDSQTGETEINACAMVRGDVASSLPEVFESHPALSQRSQSWRQLTSLVTTSPLLFRTPEPVKNGMLQAGDSAGFVDPFVGDGISLALRSGALAAESLRNFVAGRESLEDAMRGYSESYKRDLLPVFRTSSGIRRLFQVPEPFRTGILGLFHVVPMLTRYLVRKTR